MANTLLDAILAVQDIVGRVEGIRNAPEYASDNVPPGIWSMAYPDTGTFTQDPQGVLKGLHNIGLLVFAPRVSLRQTLKQLIPLGDKVAAALEKEPTLLDTISTYGGLSYTFQMEVNVGTEASPAYATGWAFVINNVKIQDETALA